MTILLFYGWTIFLSVCVYMYVYMKLKLKQLLHHVWLFVTPWIVAHQLLCPWDSLGKNIGVGNQSLFQGSFPVQGSNLGHLKCIQILYHQSHQQATYIYTHVCIYTYIHIHTHTHTHTNHIFIHSSINGQLGCFWVSLVAQLVKNLPAIWETPVWSLDWEDPLEKGKATLSSLAWRIPWTL